MAFVSSFSASSSSLLSSSSSSKCFFFEIVGLGSSSFSRTSADWSAVSKTRVGGQDAVKVAGRLLFGRHRMAPNNPRLLTSFFVVSCPVACWPRIRSADGAGESGALHAGAFVPHHGLLRQQGGLVVAGLGLPAHQRLQRLLQQSAQLRAAPPTPRESFPNTNSPTAANPLA